MWRLGGRASSFVFRDTAGHPDGGPCAQHTARELPNGNILVFDNGAWDLDKLCIDPADPTGEPVARTPTRIAEWSLDEPGGVATMVRDHQVEDRFAIFAGSVQPLDDGRAVVGWASSRGAVVSELDDQGARVWELEAVEDPQYFTYRAVKTDVPDAIAPDVTLRPLPRDAVYVEGERVRPSYRCTDRGGSTLRTCSATPVDTTSPGRGRVVVDASDGAGNLARTGRGYRVLAAYRPDAQVRLLGRRGFQGDDVYGSARRQQVRASTVGRRARQAVVRIQNDGNRPDRFRLDEVAGSDRFAVRLRRVPGSRQRSPVIAPGDSWTMRVRVVPRASARRGDRVRVLVRASSRRNADRADAVAAVVRRR